MRDFLLPQQLAAALGHVAGGSFVGNRQQQDKSLAAEAGA
jgi:hypothetical protein